MNMDTNPFSTSAGGAAGGAAGFSGSAFGQSFAGNNGGGSAFGSPHQYQQHQQHNRTGRGGSNAGNSPFVFQNKTMAGGQGFHQEQDPSMAFDPQAGSGRGRGRGRGSNTNYRGARGGGGRGGGNMTYVAPGLNQGPQTHSLGAQGPTMGSAMGDDPMSFNTGGAGGYQGSGSNNRGRGGGRGGRGGGGGAQGQYRSLQWRADGSHQQQQQQQQQPIGLHQSSTGAVNDASMGTLSQDSMVFNTFGNQGQPSLSTAQSAFNSNSPSVFGGQQSSQFPGPTPMTSTFQSGGGPINTSISGSAFGNSLGAGAGGLGLSSAFSEKRPSDSIFAAPAIIPGPKSVPVTSSMPSSVSLSTGNKFQSSGFSKDTTNEPVDAESRLARFNAVPIGNQFEELKEKRVREREEAIRQGTIPDPTKPRRLEDAITFVGTCMDMCPEYERHEREYQTSLEKFEKIPGTDSVNHALAVKAFARPAAGADQPLPSDVRPPHVLLKTLDYLMTEIVSDGNLSDSHSFVRDRTRSIRQDFTLQNNRGLEAIHAHEIIARYHIMCMHQLCEDDGFSAQQEMEQLQKVLTSLQEFYDDMKVEGTPCPNEAEFRAYHILSHLRDPDMMRQAQSLPTHIFRNPYIQVAAEMHALTRRNNDIRRRAKIQSEASPNFFSRLFKTVAGPAVTYLMACIMETHFVEIRKGALKALNKSYLDQHGGVLVKDLVQILGFDDTDECLINCQQYDLELTNHSQAAVIFGRKDQATRRRIFKESSLALKQHRNLRIVEAKRTNYSIADIVFGRTPKPHEALGKRQSIAAPMMGSTDRMGMGLVSASSASRLVPAVGIPSPAVSRVSAFSPAPQLPPSSSQPASSGPFNFGVGQLAAPTAAPAVSPFSLAGAAAGAAVTAFAASASRTANAPAAGGSSTGTWPSSALNPAAPPFQPVAPNGFSFTSAAATIAAAPAPVSAATQITPSNLVQPPILSASGPYPAVPQASQPIPAFTFKTPEKEGGSANPFAFDAGKPTTAPPLFTLPPLGSAATEATKTSTAPPISITTNRNIPGLSTGRPLPLATPPIQSPIVPKSDATRVVSKRGRIYPRTVVQAVVEEFLDREVDRMTRTTVAQLAQEVAKERTVQRAEQRKQRIWTESTLLASLVLDNVVEEMIEEIQAELFRERKLQQKVITRWKEHTIRSRRRAEELKRRQDHFLAEVKAMGSRAGLGENLMATRIRDYKAKQQRISSGVPGSGLGSGAGSVEGVKSMVETVMNKRKRMLSIGQEGSLDEALMEGLKRAAAPKREMWAPLPVYKIVDSHYRHRRDTSLSRPGSGLESGTEAGSALVKRRWRLFVNTPTFKEMGSKWLLTKLGVDMGRQTKSQQRSGAMVAVHRGSNENLDVVIHGIEDRSVVDLLGMSKYSIMETAAFMFEFSKVTLLDRDATEETIRQYWLGERARLVRFLACFPKVKQPLVFIMWTTSPEIWERMSPRVVELLELDEMVASERGPLRSYRFLVMDMSMMKLDPYVTGSLEWLASETRDFFEDPAVLLKELLDKYQPILDWGLCRISLAGAPFYSQYDEEDGDLHMINVRRRMKQQQRQKQMRAIANGTTPEPMIEWTPRSLFVEAAETGFNLAVRMFNQELESLARTIEVKGHGDTREGAAQEGRVKDAMARFVRQAELKEMKRGSIQDRINYGMDPKSAFCDYMDVFIATMGGLAKEHKNIESKTRMRTEIWEMLTTSREDRVPLEAAFKRITSQVLAWVQDGILDAKRFNVRLRKWNEQRQDLVQQQQQFQQQQSLQDTQPRGTFGDNEDQDQQSLDGDNEAFVDADGEPQGDHEQTFRPMLIDDDIDIEGIVFEYEMTVQTEIRDWEMKVEQMVRDLEETAKLVPTELETSTMTTSGLRLGGSRKRRAPERPRNALKKTRLAGAARFGRNGSVTEMNKEESLEVKEEDMNLFMSTTTVDDNILPLKKWAATLPDNKPPNGMVRDMEDSAEARLSGVAALSQLVRSLTPTLAITATTTTMMSTPSRPLTPSILAGNTLAVSNTTTPSILKPTPILGQALTGMNAATTGSTGGDRLARLRNLIKDVKTSALLAKQPHQQ